MWSSRRSISHRPLDKWRGGGLQNKFFAPPALNLVWKWGGAGPPGPLLCIRYWALCLLPFFISQNRRGRKRTHNIRQFEMSRGSLTVVWFTFHISHIMHIMGCGWFTVSSLHYITSHHITSHHITSHHITSHYITSHHITLHYITLHYITLHYITLHYITLEQHPVVGQDRHGNSDRQRDITWNRWRAVSLTSCV